MIYVDGDAIVCRGIVVGHIDGGWPTLQDYVKNMIERPENDNTDYDLGYDDGVDSQELKINDLNERIDELKARLAERLR